MLLCLGPVLRIVPLDMIQELEKNIDGISPPTAQFHRVVRVVLTE